MAYLQEIVEDSKISRFKLVVESMGLYAENIVLHHIFLVIQLVANWCLVLVCIWQDEPALLNQLVVLHHEQLISNDDDVWPCPCLVHHLIEAYPRWCIDL